MSPLTLRRYRAERLLRADFERLRAGVIATVRGRLAAVGASLDQSDLDACYGQAWQGLYAAVLDGQQIANPAAWLTLVTFRRSIEELRARRSLHRGRAARETGTGSPLGRATAPAEGSEDPDLAAELDDRIRLRQLFEGLQGRLSSREREAAVLCYLQGLPRSEAAARMGISEARMRKLMDGQGLARPGVAHKVGALAETIRAGAWCEEQGSLMRGLAYGILDPDGERYRLAQIHSDECPACRAYVLSLRGLAAVLPPVLLPWSLGAQALMHARAAIGAHPSAAGQARAAGACGHAGSGVGGALSGASAAGAGGAAGGGWLWAGGSLSTKLAVGCLVALGVGAGCVGFTDGLHSKRDPVRRSASSAIRSPAKPPYAGAPRESRPAEGERGVPHLNGAVSASAGSTPALSPAARAAREFGPERAPAPAQARSVSFAGRSPAAARSASEKPHGAGSSAPPAAPSQSSAPDAASASAGQSSAEREFGIE